MAHSVTITNEKRQGVSSYRMKVGQYARIVEGEYTGQIILKIYGGGYVLLSNATYTWVSYEPNLSVEILPPGTKIEIELKQ